MKIEVEVDLAALDVFALVFMGQTFIGCREGNPEFVDPFVNALLEEWARRTALRLGREALPPAQGIVFDLSAPEAAFAIAALGHVEGTLRPAKAKLFCKPEPAGPAWHVPAANFLGAVRTAIQATRDTGSAAPADSVKSSAPISIHGMN